VAVITGGMVWLAMGLGDLREMSKLTKSLTSLLLPGPSGSLQSDRSETEQREVLNHAQSYSHRASGCRS